MIADAAAKPATATASTWGRTFVNIELTGSRSRVTPRLTARPALSLSSARNRPQPGRSEPGPDQNGQAAFAIRAQGQLQDDPPTILQDLRPIGPGG